MIYETAGVVGVDPTPFSLRELVWMLRGRQKDAWSRTAQVLALIYWANKSPRAKKMTPNDFNPFVEKEDITINTKQFYDWVTSKHEEKNVV